MERYEESACASVISTKECAAGDFSQVEFRIGEAIGMSVTPYAQITEVEAGRTGRQLCLHGPR
jgi:hypothetical protein